MSGNDLLEADHQHLACILQPITTKSHCSPISRGPKNYKKGTQRGSNFEQKGDQKDPNYIKGDPNALSPNGSLFRDPGPYRVALGGTI